MDFNEYFKDDIVEVTIRDDQSEKLIPFNLLGNKLYVDNSRRLPETGNVFDDLALAGSSWVIRDGFINLEAVSTVDDRRFIELFFSSKEEHIKRQALKYINNEFVLAQITVDDENEEFRWMAFSGVFDMQLLEYIALNCRDWKIRLRVCQNCIRNMDILYRLYESDPCWKVRLMLGSLIHQIESLDPEDNI